MPSKPASPRTSNASPSVESVEEQIKALIGSTYADQMRILPVASSHIKNSSPVVEPSKDLSGATYADQMARVKSKIWSDHAPPKPEGMISPTRSPVKSAVPHSQSLDNSRYVSKSRCADEVGL